MNSMHIQCSISDVAPTSCLTKNGGNKKSVRCTMRRLKRKIRSEIDKRQNSKATDFQLNFFPCSSERASRVFTRHCFTSYYFMSLSKRRTNILVGYECLRPTNKQHGNVIVTPTVKGKAVMKRGVVLPITIFRMIHASNGPFFFRLNMTSHNVS